MRFVYFAQDLSDAAVARRVRLLRLGGADVTLLGFRRSITPVNEVEGVSAIDLGRTFDGRLGMRLALVGQRSLEARRWREIVRGADVLIARNLEMCTIAVAARRLAHSPVPLIYECLDIHEAVLGSSLKARLLRCWEKWIISCSSALMVSSRGFIVNYFETLGVTLPPVILAENKLVSTDELYKRPRPTRDVKPPWRIGWFGILRCTKSFKLLLELAGHYPGTIDIELRGRPTRELQSLIAQHLPLANMRYEGPYSQSDLEEIYQRCHLAWAIDFFQEGHNSSWLLPNRLYEGCYYNCPPIALAGTEIETWLKTRGAGLIIKRELEAELKAFFDGLTSSRYEAMQTLATAIPNSDLVHTVEDCRQFALRPLVSRGDAPL